MTISFWTSITSATCNNRILDLFKSEEDISVTVASMAFGIGMNLCNTDSTRTPKISVSRKHKVGSPDSCYTQFLEDAWMRNAERPPRKFGLTHSDCPCLKVWSCFLIHHYSASLLTTSADLRKARAVSAGIACEMLERWWSGLNMLDPGLTVVSLVLKSTLRDLL